MRLFGSAFWCFGETKEAFACLFDMIACLIGGRLWGHDTIGAFLSLD